MHPDFRLAKQTTAPGGQPSERHPGTGWLCGLFGLAVYLLLPNRVDGTDGVEYALAVRAGSNLFHPHHVFYNGFCFVLHRAVALVHYFDPLRFMTTLSSLATAATVALLSDLLLTLTKRPLLAVCGALAYAFTYATFYLGTTAEVYPYSVLCALGALWLFVRPRELREPTLLLIAILSALAMLFHQTGIFFVTAMSYLILQQRGHAATLRFCVYAGMACGLPYVGAGYLMGVRSPAQLVHWLFSYAHTAQFATGDWGSGLRLERLPQIIWGIVCTFTTPDYARYRGMRPLVLSGLDVLGALATVTLAAAVAWVVKLRVARGPAPTARSHRRLQQALWFWLIQQAVFTAWWDQTNCEFWYMLLPPLYLLSAMSVTGVADLGRGPRIALALIPLGFAVANFCGHIYGDSRPERSALEQLVAGIGCARIHDGDTFVGPINDLPPYIQYACRRSVRVTNIAEARVSPGGGAALASYAQHLFTPPTQVFLLEPELDEALQQLYRAPSWTIAEIRAFYAPYLARAAVIGQFRFMNRSWRIYQLNR